MLNRRANIRPILPFALASASLVGLTTLCYQQNIRFNSSSSMPYGLYKKANGDINRGSIIAACLPSNIAIEGVKRGYLGKGICPDGSSPIIKKLIGLPGDQIIINQKEIIVNGQHYLAPQQRYDSNKLLIRSWVKINTPINSNGYWLYGENNPTRSWDSRYYGSIKIDNLVGKYKPLVIF